MKIFKLIAWLVVALLSIAAGAAKLVQMPQEVSFFRDAGLSMTVMMLAGGVQALAGILVFFRHTRRWGAALASLSFLASTGLILLHGEFRFALFSLIPVLLAGFVLATSGRPTPKPQAA